MDKIEELKQKIVDSLEPEEKVSLLIELAYETRFIDPAFSLNTAKTAWQTAKSASDPELELRSLISISSSFYSRECFAELYKWSTLLADKAREYGKLSALGRANLFFYAYNNHFGKVQEAENYLKKALENFEAEKNLNGITTCYISLGNLQFNQENYECAYDHYQTALKLCPEERNEIRFTLRQNIASVYIVQGKYLKAWEEYQNLLDGIPEHEYATRALILMNLGSVGIYTGELTAALQYLDEAIELTKKVNQIKIHIKAHCKKVEIYLEQNNLRKAEQLAMDIEENFNKGEHSDLFSTMYKGFISYHEKTGNLPEAEKYKAKLSKI